VKHEWVSVEIEDPEVWELPTMLYSTVMLVKKLWLKWLCPQTKQSAPKWREFILFIWREQICVVYTKESKSALKEQVSSLLAEIPCIDGLICWDPQVGLISKI